MTRRPRPAALPQPSDAAPEDPPARIGTKRSPEQRTVALPDGYAELLASIKADVGRTQVRAALAANRELIALYWRIGREIVARQAGATWGTAVLERLAADLRSAFPGVAGFSRTNLFRIRGFYLAWSAGTSASPAVIVPQLVGQLPAGGPVVSPAGSRQQGPDDMAVELPDLPWGHQVTLIERLKDRDARRWYARAAVEHGWSRSVLELQIDRRLYDRQGGAVTNFAATLPAPDSDLAREVPKDPYLFDFLTLAGDATERDVEDQLVAHVQRFLLELGAGFAFVGRQVHLEVDGEDYRIDLLFYHLRLRCYVVLELKNGPFRPEYAGKLNFYLSAVDDLMRHPDDRPSIGLLLCRSKQRTVVEYALRDMGKPIGVAEWVDQLTATLPDELRGSLPTVEEFERELGALPDD